MAGSMVNSPVVLLHVGLQRSLRSSTRPTLATEWRVVEVLAPVLSL